MTHEQNERLLTLLSEYLCFQPDAIAPADVAAFSADAHLPPEDAYRMLLSAKLGLTPTVRRIGCSFATRCQKSSAAAIPPITRRTNISAASPPSADSTATRR